MDFRPFSLTYYFLQFCQICPISSKFFAVWLNSGMLDSFEELCFETRNSSANFGKLGNHFCRQPFDVIFTMFTSSTNSFSPRKKLRRLSLASFQLRFENSSKIWKLIADFFLSNPNIRKLDQFLKNRNILDIFSTRKNGSCLKFEVYWNQDGHFYGTYRRNLNFIFRNSIETILDCC
ncbi:unnamed protein product [Caenorhabditis angaria]|uniref:Uncharacterized protein n=1 Tax=Caenorhabditis angaria TaxID=860376 RepID=A0A9P1IM86_9PELO|nr:unnamed protein product [Caenorhabditis angaria]